VVNPQGGPGAVPGFQPVPVGASGEQQPARVPFGAFPGSPGVPAQTGVSVPGMIVQPPAPASPGSPGAAAPGVPRTYPGVPPVPGQPVRRPGGQ
jgi:hypothetical protein